MTFDNLTSTLTKIIERYYLIFILLFSVPAILSLLKFGFYGASDDIHIAWLFEMDRAIKTNQIPPRFVPDLSYQFGYPLFNFVFPLPFYIGELFHLLGLSFVDSIKAVFLISVPLSGVFMYKLLKEFANSSLSLAGAMIYIFTPYRSTDLYVRGAIGEVLSFIFFPVIILSLVNIFKKESPLGWIGLGAIGIGGLILTHNIAAFMFLPFAFLLAMIELFLVRTFNKKFLIYLLITFGLGILISVYFWFPAISESQLVKYDTVFNFQDHFPTISQLVTPYWGYGASVPGPYDTMSFFVGSINWLLVFLGLIILIFFWKRMNHGEKFFLIWVFVSFISAILMMNYRSTVIWQIVPFLPYFQFPWRFLMITTFVTPILIICLNKIPKNELIAFFLLGFVVFLNTSFFRPQDFLGRTDGYFLNRYIPWPSASLDYSQTQEEYLRLPTATQKRPDKIYPSIFETPDVTEIKKINSLDTEVKIDSKEPIVLNYNKYFFPGWKAILDSQETPIIPGKPFGQIAVQIPSGKHLLIIEFEEQVFHRILDIASLLGVLFALWLIFKKDIIFGENNE